MYKYCDFVRLKEQLSSTIVLLIFIVTLTALLNYINFAMLSSYMYILNICTIICVMVLVYKLIYILIIKTNSKEVIVHVHQNHYFNDLDKTYLMWDLDNEVYIGYAQHINLIEAFDIDDENDIPPGKFVDYGFYLPNNIEQSLLSYNTKRSYREYSNIILRMLTTSPYDEDYYMKISINNILHKFDIIERVK